MHRMPVAAALLVLILLGCQTNYQQLPYQQLPCQQLPYQQLPYQQLMDKPEVEFKEKEQQFISFFEAEPIFRFLVDNTNPMGLPIKNMTYSLTILDQKFIKGISDQDLHIRPASSKIVALALPFNFMDVFDTADEFQKTAHARFDLTGEVNIGPFSTPYDISGEFDIPRIPSVIVEAIEIGRLDSNVTRLNMTIVLNNPNSFPTPKGFLEYSTSLEGQPVAGGWLTPISAIDARAEKRMIIPVDVTATRMNGRLDGMLKKNTAAYVLTGSIRYAVPGRGRRSFPFTNAGNVPLTHRRSFQRLK